MAAKKNPFRNIRLVYQPSSPKLKILIIVMLAVCTITLLTIVVGINVSKANTAAMAQKGAALEQENAAINEDLSETGSTKWIKDLARRFLGLFDPDTMIISPEE